MLITDKLYQQVFYFCGWVGMGWMGWMGGGEELRLKLTSAKVEVEVEAVHGNMSKPQQ